MNVLIEKISTSTVDLTPNVSPRRRARTLGPSCPSRNLGVPSWHIFSKANQKTAQFKLRADTSLVDASIEVAQKVAINLFSFAGAVTFVNFYNRIDTRVSNFEVTIREFLKNQIDKSEGAGLERGRNSAKLENLETEIESLKQKNAQIAKKLDEIQSKLPFFKLEVKFKRR